MKNERRAHPSQGHAPARSRSSEVKGVVRRVSQSFAPPESTKPRCGWCARSRPFRICAPQGARRATRWFRPYYGPNQRNNGTEPSFKYQHQGGGLTPFLQSTRASARCSLAIARACSGYVRIAPDFSTRSAAASSSLIATMSCASRSASVFAPSLMYRTYTEIPREDKTPDFRQRVLPVSAI